jgi:hypothetical protein
MTTIDFIAKLTKENKELTSKMEACKAPEEAYKIAKGEGLTDSFEAFVADMKKLNEAVKNLSEDDLADVAGGGLTTYNWTDVLNNPDTLRYKIPDTEMLHSFAGAPAAASAS